MAVLILISFLFCLNVAFLKSVINGRRGSKIGFVRNVHYSNDANNFFILHLLTSIVQKNPYRRYVLLKYARAPLAATF